jgi:hypothetical protein
MLQTIDFLTNRLIAGVNNRESLPQNTIEVIRGDTGGIDWQFVEPFVGAVEIDDNGASPDLPLTMTFGAKLPGDYAGEFLISSTTFSKIGSGATTIYRMPISLNTTEINDELVDGVVNQTVADAAARLALTGLSAGAIVGQSNDGTYWELINAAAPSVAGSWAVAPQKSFVELDAQLEVILDSRIFSTLKFTLRVNNDVIKGNEGVPTAANPSYPAPGDILVTSDINDTVIGTDAMGAFGETLLGTETKAEAGAAFLDYRTTAFTAANGGKYVCAGTFEITNPGSGAAGQAYQVIVLSGAITINGVAFAPSRFPILVAHNGSAWQTLPQTLMGDLSLPNAAFGSNNALTGATGDARYGIIQASKTLTNNQTMANGSNFFGGGSDAGSPVPINFLPGTIEMQAEVEFTTAPISILPAAFTLRAPFKDVQGANLNSSINIILTTQSVTKISTFERYVIKGSTSSMPTDLINRLSTYGFVLYNNSGDLINNSGGSLTLVNAVQSRVMTLIRR